MLSTPAAVAAQLERFTITTSLVFELASLYDGTDEMIASLASAYVRWNFERAEVDDALGANTLVLAQARIRLAALSGEPPMITLHCDRRGQLACPSYHHALFAMLTRYVPDLGMRWATSDWQPIPIGPEEKVAEALRPNDWSMLPTWGRQNLMNPTGSIAFTRVEQEIAQIEMPVDSPLPALTRSAAKKPGRPKQWAELEAILQNNPTISNENAAKVYNQQHANRNGHKKIYAKTVAQVRKNLNRRMAGGVKPQG